MFEVSIGNEILRTVKGNFENGNQTVNFIEKLMAEGYDSSEIYIYFTNTGLLKTYQEVLKRI